VVYGEIYDWSLIEEASATDRSGSAVLEYWSLETPKTPRYGLCWAKISSCLNTTAWYIWCIRRQKTHRETVQSVLRAVMPIRVLVANFVQLRPKYKEKERCWTKIVRVLFPSTWMQHLRHWNKKGINRCIDLWWQRIFSCCHINHNVDYDAPTTEVDSIYQTKWEHKKWWSSLNVWLFRCDRDLEDDGFPTTIASPLIEYSPFVLKRMSQIYLNLYIYIGTFKFRKIYCMIFL
jgi:hypothetical protein